MKLSHQDRITALLEKQKPDRVPVSFWRHFYLKEQTVPGLVEAMFGFQKKFDWDFMKINPRASYHVEDWGARFSYSKNQYIKPRCTFFPVQKSSDWEKIKVLDPADGSLGEQLLALTLIKKKLNKNLFFVQTVFSPLSIAGDLVRSQKLLQNELKHNSAKVHKALENITQSFEKYVVEVLNTGCDGIFFATTEWASRDLISDKQYLEFGKPYDLRILKKVQEARFNILHICKKNNLLTLFTDYPVQAISWDATSKTNLNLLEGYNLFKNKIVLGGISHKKTLVQNNSENAILEAKTAYELMARKAWILGPGCAVPPGAPEKNLKALRNLADKLTY